MPDNYRPKREKKEPGYEVPQRTTAENFRLNLTEEDIMANSAPIEPQRTESFAAPSSRKIYYTEKERKQEEKEHKKRNKLKSKKNKRIFKVMWLLMVLLVSFTLASYLIKGSNDFLAIDRPEGEAEVTIPQGGVDSESLAKILIESGVIDRDDFFSLYSDMTVDDWSYFEPGVYKMSTNMDYEEIINRLQGGNASKEEVNVLFREGLTVMEMGQLLEENEVCTSADFLNALNTLDFSNYDMIAEIAGTEGKYYMLEGYLFPDTYTFYKGEELNSVIGKMLANFQARLDDTIRQQIADSGMTMDQVITLASIIQSEAADANDMYNVSAVLNNRLDYGEEYGLGMLQCDSTQYYPYRKNGVPEGASFGNYDTYQISGLPAGAICNPGLDAIRAALNPSDDSWLYFCHSADGTPYYAYTESEHIDNQYEAGLLE